jgi:hypothetical protein
MFDTIGTHHDPEQRMRRVVSACTTSLVVAVLGTGMAWVGAETVPRVRTVLDSEPVEAVLVDLETVDTPAAPEPPPLPTRSARQADARADRPSDKSQPRADPPAVSSPAAAARELASAPDGESPSPDQALGGFLLATIPGTPPTTSGIPVAAIQDDVPPAPVRVAEDDLRLRRRIDPAYPVNRHSRAECAARIVVGANGRAQSVLVDGCSRAFAHATEEAVWRWRWVSPSTLGHERVEVVYVVAFVPER